MFLFISKNLHVLKAYRIANYFEGEKLNGFEIYVILLIHLIIVRDLKIKHYCIPYIDPSLFHCWYHLTSTVVLLLRLLRYYVASNIYKANKKV